MNFNIIYNSFPWKTLTVLCFAIYFLAILSVNMIFTSAAASSNNLNANESYWSIGPKLSTARNELTAVELNNKIYAMGGEDKAAGGGQKKSVEVYDPIQEKWTKDKISPMPLPLDHTESAVFDGKIYVVGGFLGGKVPTDRAFVYDPEKNEWKEITSMPSPTGAALNAEFIGGILYVVGGLNASHIPVNTNYAYDPKTDTWTTKSPMPTARHHIATAVVDGKLYAMGGRFLGNGVPSEDMRDTLTNFNRLEIYDPETDTWTVGQPMPTKRSGFTATEASDGNIYVFGGQGVGGEDINSVEKYDPKTDKWTSEAPMPTGRFGIISVPFHDRIYVLGGQLISEPGLVPLDVNEIFHIGKGQKQCAKHGHINDCRNAFKTIILYRRVTLA